MDTVTTHVQLAATALRGWTRRQWLAALAGTVGFGLLVGLSTVLIPNPVFGREIATVAWNYPVWAVTSVLAGLLLATYVSPAPGSGGASAATQRQADGGGSSNALGITGGVLAWFAVGCPVCNKIALLALGYSGALTWFAPLQPILGAAAIALSAVALVVRLKGQVACAVPAYR